MNEKEFAKSTSKLMLDIDKRPYAPGKRKSFKKMIDDSKLPLDFAAAFTTALNHPFSAR